MKDVSKFIVLILLSLALMFTCGNVLADDDDHDDENKYFPPVSDVTYRQACGVCHFPYQPGLLPAGSWEKILARLPVHFTVEVSLSQEQKTVISEYLRSNAADHTSAKRSRKILKSLRGDTPLRITETPYIREKHHELDADIFRRPSIGSFSNCDACHTRAKQGNYDDDYVKIPK